MKKMFIITVSGLIALALLAAIRDAYGAVPFTFSSGTTAKAAEVNANFSNLDTRLNPLEGGQQGSTTSDGCIDLTPNPPDCSACSTGTGTCVIGPAAYPAANWVYLAKYTLPAHGELSVSVEPSIICTGERTGAVLGISLALADTAASFPPTDPAGGAIEYTELALGSYPVEYEIIPWNTALLIGRTTTQGALTPGNTYKIFLTATTVSGTVNNCFFIEAPVHLRFTPLPAATVNITPN